MNNNRRERAWAYTCLFAFTPLSPVLAPVWNREDCDVWCRHFQINECLKGQYCNSTKSLDASILLFVLSCCFFWLSTPFNLSVVMLAFNHLWKLPVPLLNVLNHINRKVKSCSTISWTSDRKKVTPMKKITTQQTKHVQTQIIDKIGCQNACKVQCLMEIGEVLYWSKKEGWAVSRCFRCEVGFGHFPSLQ